MISNIETNYVAFQQHKNYTTHNMLPGNIIPHAWYSEIVTETGKPDLNAIPILSEIVYWYRPSKDGASKFSGTIWQTSYDHFEQKFGFNKQKIRRAFVRLEELGIIKRELKTIYLYGQKYNNVLFIHLSDKFRYSLSISKSNNCETIGSHSEYDDSSSMNKNFESNNTTAQDIGATFDLLTECENSNSINDQTTNEASKQNTFLLPIYDFDTPSLQNCRDYIKKEENNEETNKNRSRSNESNFFELSKKINDCSFDKNANSSFEKGSYSKKTLLDFYPISSTDCFELRKLSCREFSDNAINEILKDVSRKRMDRYFYSKKGFLAYMAKLLTYEMRDAVAISEEGFRIRNNMTDEQKTTERIEKYLADIENSTEVSKESHFRKKLASVLENKAAYMVLTNCKGHKLVDDKFVMYMTAGIDLNDREKEIVLNQARSVYQNCTGQGGISHISDIELVLVEGTNIKVSSVTETEVEIPDNEWGRVRKRLIRYYGKTVDDTWFSRLEGKVDDSGKIMLRASSCFIRDWIKNQYLCMIENFCGFEGLQLCDITV